MKILMLGWELPPVNSGGLGVASYHLCRQLAASGVAIDFVMPYPLATPDRPDFMRIISIDHNVQITTASHLGAYSAWSLALRAQQKRYHGIVAALVAQNDYDVIHAHDWLTLEAGVLAKKLTGKPLVAHVHSTEFDRCGDAQSGNPLVHEIEYTCLLMADKIIAVSQATKRTLVDRYNLPPDKIDVIYNATDPTTLQPDRTNAYVYLQAMKAQGYTVAVSLARLTVQKGLTYLLLAAQRAVQLHPKLLFVVIGDGEQRNELIAKAAEYGIADNVIFTGFLRGKQWRDAYHIADLFIMSSVSEPFGLTALEAGACSNAVVLTHQSGVSEVLRSTLKYDYWDTVRLADIIVNIAEHHALRHTLAQQVSYEVQNLSWQNVAQQMQALYRSLTGAPV